MPPFANFVTPWRWQSGSSLKNTIQKFLCKGTTSGSQDSAKDALAFQSLQFLSLPKLLKSVLGPAGTSPSCALLPLISRSACELGSSSSAGQGGPSKHSPPASAPTRRTRTGTQAHRHPPTGTHRAHTEHTPNTPHAHSHRDADTHTLSGVSLREAGRSGLPELVMCEQACSSEGCEPGAWPVYPDRWGLPHWRRVGGGHPSSTGGGPVWGLLPDFLTGQCLVALPRPLGESKGCLPAPSRGLCECWVPLSREPPGCGPVGCRWGQPFLAVGPAVSFSVGLVVGLVGSAQGGGDLSL